MPDATLRVGIWDHIDLAQWSSDRQISFFPHPSLWQAWYLFELQHQSHGDNGFFDIAAVGRVVQPIGNVLPCIPLAEVGSHRFIML